MDTVCRPFAGNTTPNCVPYHQVLLCIIGALRKRPDYGTALYSCALEITGCQNLEKTLRTKILS